MNNAQLNGEPLGAAAAGVYVPTSMAVTGYSTSSTCFAYLIYHLNQNQACSATHTTTFKYLTQCASSVTAAASSSFSYVTYLARLVSSSILASASGVITVTRRTYTDSLQSAIASADAAFIKAITWASSIVGTASANAVGTVFFGVASSVTSTATSTFNWDTTGYHSSPDRTMVVPAEDRTMAVT